MIEENYTFSGSRQDIESSWEAIPNNDLKAINSSKFLLVSFTIENVKVYLFKSAITNIESKHEITITVVSMAAKEVNLIVKSSFVKIYNLFQEKLVVKMIEGTKINIYPFDSDKNDIISPHFFLKADFEKDGANPDLKYWIKLAVFTLITIVFVILFFNTPNELPSEEPGKTKPNNLKEVYSAVMGLGITFIIIEIIANLLIPHFFRSKYPKVSIKTFSNVFENNRTSKITKIEKPVDPIVND